MSAGQLFLYLVILSSSAFGFFELFKDIYLSNIYERHLKQRQKELMAEQKYAKNEILNNLKENGAKIQPLDESLIAQLEDKDNTLIKSSTKSNKKARKRIMKILYAKELKNKTMQFSDLLNDEDKEK